MEYRDTKQGTKSEPRNVHRYTIQADIECADNSNMRELSILLSVTQVRGISVVFRINSVVTNGESNGIEIVG